MTPKCVVIPGYGNCGTSVMAGIVHELGFPMGTEFMGVPEAGRYPTGTFEDVRLVALNERYFYDILDGNSQANLRAMAELAPQAAGYLRERERERTKAMAALASKTHACRSC